EPEDLLERRRPAIRHAFAQELRHRVLPPRRDLLLRHVGPGRGEIVGLEVPEDVGARAEDRVVANAGAAEGVEHLRPDVSVRLDVLVDAVGPDVQDEGASLGHETSWRTRTNRFRGPCTPSTRESSMSEVADGPEMSVIGRRARPRSARAVKASGT